MDKIAKQDVYNDFKLSKQTNMFTYLIYYLQYVSSNCLLSYFLKLFKLIIYYFFKDCEILFKLLLKIFYNYLKIEDSNFILQNKFTLSSIAFEEFFIK